jgi:hypothetical protein
MYHYFPAWLPDAYISLRPSPNSKVTPKRFFLDIWDGTRPFFISVRKARNYITYAEEGDWPTDKSAFPAVLIICENPRAQKKLNRQIRKALDESYEEMIYATTIMELFMVSMQIKDKMWQTVDEESNITTLAEL